MKVKICPRCSSKNVKLDDTFKFEQRAGLFRYSCNKCGYTGPMIEETKPKGKSRENKKV